MKNKVRVEKINVKIGDVTVSLKLEDAKELRKLLNDLFGANDEFTYVPIGYPVYPYDRWVTWSDNTSGCALGESGGTIVGESSSGTVTYSLRNSDTKLIIES